jgi:hypothetical protein
MEVYSTGHCGDHDYAEGEELRCYPLDKFVVGHLVGSTENDNSNGGYGGLTEVHVDQRAEQSKALQSFAELCEKLGIKEVVAGENLPKFYIVCYNSY